MIANLEMSVAGDVHIQEIVPTASQLIALKLLQGSQTIFCTDKIFQEFAYKNDTSYKE